MLPSSPRTSVLGWSSLTPQHGWSNGSVTWKGSSPGAAGGTTARDLGSVAERRPGRPVVRVSSAHGSSTTTTVTEGNPTEPARRPFAFDLPPRGDGASSWPLGGGSA